MLNVPNTLTVLRILLVPAIVVALLRQNYGIALGIFLCAGASDGLDGFIARRFNLCTPLGAVLDPLADKLLVVSSAMVLGWLGGIPWWLVAIIVGRDLVIVLGAIAYYRRAGHLEMAPSLLSKANTFLQISLILIVLANSAGLIAAARWLPALFLVTLSTALVSGGHYVAVWSGKAAARQTRSHPDVRLP
jgi:cardiolipin synthase